MYLKVFLKIQRLCTISNGNANVTTLYTQNNEFERPKLMCQDLVGRKRSELLSHMTPTACFRQGKAALSSTLK